jgi:hypothetical protein
MCCRCRGGLCTWLRGGRVSVGASVGVGLGVCLWCGCRCEWGVGVCFCGCAEVCVCGVSGCERGLAWCGVSDMRRGVAGVGLWTAAGSAGGRASGPVQPGEELAKRRLSKGKCGMWR